MNSTTISTNSFPQTPRTRREYSEKKPRRLRALAKTSWLKDEAGTRNCTPATGSGQAAGILGRPSARGQRSGALRGIAPGLLALAVLLGGHSALGSAYYDYRVVAQTGSDILRLGKGPSMAPDGRVGFIARVAAEGTQPEHDTVILATDSGLNELTPASLDPAHEFREDVQVTAAGTVVAFDKWLINVMGTVIPEANIRGWFYGAGSPIQVARTVGSGGLTDSPGVANSGSYVAYGYYDGSSTWITLYDTQTFLETINLWGPVNPNGRLHYRPMVSNNGRVVVRIGDGVADPIWLSTDSTLAVPQRIAAWDRGGFAHRIGASPGINADASIVGFAGQKTADTPPGVYISVQLNLADNRAARQIIRVVGDTAGRQVGQSDLGTAGDGTPLYFSDIDVDTRVSVVSLPNGASGLEDDSVLICFTGTPNAASPVPPAGCPASFTLARGIWVARGTLRRSAQNPAELSFRMDELLPVIQLGETVIGLGPVTDLAINDCFGVEYPPAGADLATYLKNHKLTFWAKGASKQGIVVTTSGFQILPIQSVLNWQLGAAAKNQFALVAGKDLVLRAFFNTGRNGPTTEALARLWIDGRQIEHLTASAMAYPLGHSFQTEDRRQALDSLNIFITGVDANTLLTPGLHQFAVDVSPTVPGAFPTARSTITGEFRESRNLNLFVVPITLPSVTGLTVSPDRDLITDCSELIKDVFPIDDDSVTTHILHLLPSAELDMSRGFPGQEQTFLKDAKSAIAVSSTLSARTLGFDDFFVAVLPGPNRATSPIGQPAYSEAPSGVVVTYDRSWSPAATDYARPYTPCLNANLAHELGHSFARDLSVGFGDEYAPPLGGSGGSSLNPPHSNSFDSRGTAAGNYVLEEDLAFDVRGVRPLLAQHDPNLLPSMESPKALFVVLDPFAPAYDVIPDPLAAGPIYGFMQGTGRSASATRASLGARWEGLCDTRSWVRSKEYEYMYPKFTRLPASPAPRRGPKDGSGSRAVLLVAGLVEKSGAGTLSGLFPCVTAADFPPPAGSNYTVQVCSLNGTVLSEASFDLTFQINIMDDGLVPTEVSPFCFGVDLHPGAVSVRLLKQGVVLATSSRGTNRPTVALTSMQQLPDSHLQVTWSGDDPDGDQVHYMVMYSPDGVNNYALVSDTTNTSLTLSLTNFPPPAGNATVTVHAYDGLNWSETALVFNPLLLAEQSGNQVALSWPAAAAGFQLQATATLASAGTWNWITNTPTVVGGRWRVKLDAGGDSQFFRLAKQ